jgi:hypothetical protein
MSPDSIDDSRASARLRTWTRKVHNYLGLYLMLWLWLFSVSGLVLNHSRWQVAGFWKLRRESTTDRALQSPRATGDLAIAMELMGQLGIAGELQETKRSPDGDQFEFQVVKPGRIVRVAARLAANGARVTETKLNGWGTLQTLHTFSGVRIDDPSRTRDWSITKLWSLAMDAVAFGLVTVVISGIYLWCRRSGRRWPGAVALGLGVALCAFFVAGLGTLFG